MKNIHLIPTDKPSLLFRTNKRLVFDNDNPPIACKTGQHIYITSDEKIKEGTCFLTNNCEVFKCVKIKEEQCFYNDFGSVLTKFCKKIILTTDQDLINDGVQAINNEFLGWFVNNTSCEYVEVKKRFSDFTVEPFIGYKIIIPKPCTQDVVDEAMKIVSKDVRQPKCVRDGLVTEQNKHSRLDVLHLEWIYNRMIEVHNENPSYDYMIKFKQIITKHENFL